MKITCLAVIAFVLTLSVDVKGNAIDVDSVKSALSAILEIDVQIKSEESEKLEQPEEPRAPEDPEDPRAPKDTENPRAYEDPEDPRAPEDPEDPRAPEDLVHPDLY